MPRFEFTSPGAAAGNAIRQFLLDQEQRRLALDREARLKQHDAQQLELGKAQLASLDEQRKAEQALRGEQLKAAQIKTAESTHKIGDVLGEGDQTPAELRIKQQSLGARSIPMMAGMLPSIGAGNLNPTVTTTNADTGAPETPAPAPVVEAQTMAPTATGRETYKGTSAQQDTLRKQDAMDALMANPKIPEEAKAMVKAGVLDGSALVKYLEGPKQGRDILIDTRKGIMHLMTPHGLEPLPADFQRTADDRTHDMSQPSALVSLAQFSPEAVAAYQRLVEGGTVQPTITRSNAPLMNQVLTNIGKGEGGAQAIEDLVGARAGHQADAANLTQITKNYGAVKSFADTAQKNIDRLKSVLSNTPDLGASILNKPWRSLQGKIGNVDMAKFAADLGTVQPELARILNSANMTGVNTVHAQEEVNKMLDPNYTVAQLLGALGELEADMRNREGSILEAKTEAQKSITSRGARPHTTPGNTPAFQQPSAGVNADDPLDILPKR